MSKAYYMRRYNAQGVLGFNGPIYCANATKAISLALEIPKYKAGDTLRVSARTKSGQWIEIAEFITGHAGHRVWWEEVALEWGELIKALCESRKTE